MRLNALSADLGRSCLFLYLITHFLASCQFHIVSLLLPGFFFLFFWHSHRDRVSNVERLCPMYLIHYMKWVSITHITAFEKLNGHHSYNMTKSSVDNFLNSLCQYLIIFIFFSSPDFGKQQMSKKNTSNIIPQWNWDGESSKQESKNKNQLFFDYVFIVDFIMAIEHQMNA